MILYVKSETDLEAVDELGCFWMYDHGGQWRRTAFREPLGRHYGDDERRRAMDEHRRRLDSEILALEGLT